MARVARAARAVALILAASIAIGGCTSLGGKEPFGPFAITTTGGVGGIWTRLDVDVDGTVVLIGDRPVGGRLQAADLDELRRLLTGKRIRREAAGSNTGRGDRCADGFTRTLVMGRLRVSRYFCAEPVHAPAFERVLDLTATPRLQRLASPPAVPGLPVMTLTRTGNAGGVAAQYTVTPDAQVTLRRPSTPAETGSLGPELVDALRLLLRRPLQVAFSPDCPAERSHRLSVAGPQPASAVVCDGVGPPYPELRAIVRSVISAFE